MDWKYCYFIDLSDCVPKTTSTTTSSTTKSTTTSASTTTPSISTSTFRATNICLWIVLWPFLYAQLSFYSCFLCREFDHKLIIYKYINRKNIPNKNMLHFILCGREYPKIVTTNANLTFKCNTLTIHYSFISN